MQLISQKTKICKPFPKILIPVSFLHEPAILHSKTMTAFFVAQNEEKENEKYD